MEDEQNSAQVSEGVADETASQGSEPVAQATEQSQQDATVKVDNGESQPSSEPEARPRPSQSWGKREFRRLENQLAQMRDAFQAFQQNAPAASVAKQPLNPEDFYKNPQEYIDKLVNERLAGLKGEIPKTFAELERTKGMQRDLQEAERMIVTNEAIKKDPQGQDRIKEILYDEEFKINKISEQFPVEAARLALALYNQRFVSNVSRRSAVSAPTKSQMQSTATSVNGGAKKSSLGDEYTKLRNELMADPMKANDSGFVERLNALKQRRQLEQQAAQ